MGNSAPVGYVRNRVDESIHWNANEALWGPRSQESQAGGGSDTSGWPLINAG